MNSVHCDFTNPNMDYNVPAGSFTYLRATPDVFGWSTDNQGSFIEVWSDGFSGYDADTPIDFLENQIIDDLWHLAVYRFNTGDERTWKIEFKAFTETGGLGNLFDTAHVLPIGDVKEENPNPHKHTINHHSSF